MLPINLREEWLSHPEGDYPARTILGFPNSKQKQSGGLGLYYICGDRVLATYSPASDDKMLDRKGFGLENWPWSYKVIDPKKEENFSTKNAQNIHGKIEKLRLHLDSKP